MISWFQACDFTCNSYRYTEVTKLFRHVQREREHAAAEGPRGAAAVTRVPKRWASILSPCEKGDDYETLGKMDVQAKLAARLKAASKDENASSQGEWVGGGAPQLLLR